MEKSNTVESKKADTADLQAYDTSALKQRLGQLRRYL